MKTSKKLMDWCFVTPAALIHVEMQCKEWNMLVCSEMWISCIIIESMPIMSNHGKTAAIYVWLQPLAICEGFVVRSPKGHKKI